MAEDADVSKTAAALHSAVRACIEAGMAVTRVEVDPDTGKVTVHGKPAEPVRDEWLPDCDNPAGPLVRVEPSALSSWPACLYG